MTAAHDFEMAYRRAFDEFARQVGQVQALAANPKTDRNTIETALAGLESARAEYNCRRDKWAEYLLQSSRDSYHFVQHEEDRLCTSSRW